MLRTMSLVALVLLVALAVPAVAADKAAGKIVAIDPAKAGPDFAFQGEYVGVVNDHGKEGPMGAQIIALGDGKFHGVGYIGGLPGEGWAKGGARRQCDGELKDGAVKFKTPDSKTAVVKDGVITVCDADGNTVGTLKKVERKSPTMGAKPPAGAVVLFDGTSADQFIGGRMTPDGLLMEGPTSKQKFQNATYHAEFLLPFMPSDRGQGRGNSGFYAQGRYETQILDSFGLEGKNNECGGIYGVAEPKVNMCLPPLAWQTYDVDLVPAEFKDGQKVKNARITVRHNGVLIHDNVEIPHGTTAAPVKEGPEPGPVYLQNHGCPVRFRNVWVVEKK